MLSRIGIKPEINHGVLWFYPEGLAMGTMSYGVRLIARHEVPAEDWQMLTAPGRKVAGKVLSLTGIDDIVVFPERFRVSLEATDPGEQEWSWGTVLPGIVGAIHNVQGPQRAKIYAHPPGRDTPEWHIPLLQKLFGPENLAQPRFCDGCPFSKPGVVTQLVDVRSGTMEFTDQLLAGNTCEFAASAWIEHYHPDGMWERLQVDIDGISPDALGDQVRLCQSPRHNWLQRMLGLGPTCGIYRSR